MSGGTRMNNIISIEKGGGLHGHQTACCADSKLQLAVTEMMCTLSDDVSSTAITKGG